MKECQAPTILLDRYFLIQLLSDSTALYQDQASSLLIIILPSYDHGNEELPSIKYDVNRTPKLAALNPFLTRLQ